MSFPVQVNPESPIVVRDNVFGGEKVATSTNTQTSHRKGTPVPKLTFSTSTSNPADPLSTPIEEYSDEDSKTEDIVMSPAAQAAALSSFLSVASSDSDEGESQARIADVYREPLDLDGIEAAVLGILRTGKLTIQGQPGDVSKIQPALFALQPNEKDLPGLIPQLMQTPLFNQKDAIPETTTGQPLTMESLQNGQFCLGHYIDTAIYTLLKGHCAKNAKQAEAIITTLMSVGFVPVRNSTLPGMLFDSQMPSKRATIAINGNNSSHSSLGSSGASGASMKSSTSSLEEEKSASPEKATSRRRKQSIAIRHSSVSISSDDDGVMSRWKSSIVDNCILASQYGDTTLPMLMWNPKLTLDFEVRSSLGPYCGIVTGIDPSNKIITVRILNNISQKVAFCIRSFRQSSMFESKIACPLQGLQVLDVGQRWEDSVELHPMIVNKGVSETFVIDLLVCSLEGKQPSWNVLRKYAAMKGVKAEAKGQNALKIPKRLNHKRLSVFFMPGTKEQKEENMKTIIMHGLQCVVKGKLDEAEVILTQALMLPDFQRIEIKAFLYICLAVVANKRHSKGPVDSLLPVLNKVSAASQLVDAVETTRGTMRMPRMIQLVNQLKKELDVEKITREHRQRSDGRKSPRRVDELQTRESAKVTPAGGALTYGSTTLFIPENALKERTEVTLSSPESAVIDDMLKHAGWNSMVKIIAAVHVDCDPITTRFRVPIEITTSMTHKLSSDPQCIRLVHSNYLRHWRDLTSDPCSRVVQLGGDMLTISSDRSGWLAVTCVDFDPSQIVLKAMRALSTEPLVLHFSVYGLFPPDSNMIQVVVFISPHRATDEKPKHHVPIAFPQSIQAYPGEKIKLTFKGSIEPEAGKTERDLSFEFNVRDRQTSVCEKWLTLTTGKETPFSSSLIVASCSPDKVLSEIRLSSKSGFSSTSPPTNRRTNS